MKLITLSQFYTIEGRLSQAKAYHRELQTRFKNVIQNTINNTVYKTDSGYLIYGQVPSEHNSDKQKDIFYDVIVELYTTKKKKEELDQLNKIDQYYIRCFSNSPVFMFNFTYVYNKNDLLYETGISKKLYSEKALKNAPKIMNPYQVPSMEKTVWYVMEKIFNQTGFRKDRMDELVVNQPDKKGNYKLDYNKIFAKVVSQVAKLIEIQESKKIVKKKLQHSSKISVNKKEAKVIDNKNVNFGTSLKVEKSKESPFKKDMKGSFTANTKSKKLGMSDSSKKDIFKSNNRVSFSNK
jgi:hypothetical protein